MGNVIALPRPEARNATAFEGERAAIVDQMAEIYRGQEVTQPMLRSALQAAFMRGALTGDGYDLLAIIDVGQKDRADLIDRLGAQQARLAGLTPAAVRSIAHE